ncbi:aldo-keto reductase AKR2E4 [Plutella xylostella]|uniref:aldo-keto reductase AKR2E4 n=1 Tax=Plutella xylostella TaxID=51655 RepID=UPI002032C5DF|nr:aldo-keto reductase AKR2E4 [Plutella xylostella]
MSVCYRICNRSHVDTMTKVNIPTFKLNNGRDIPALGYGTWLGLDDKLQFLSQDVPKMVEAMSHAIDVGYRHIDTAHLYRVEPEVGQVLNKKIEEGVARREDFFVTTKVWQHNHSPAGVEASVRASLRRMKLEYLDLVLMHWPMAISEDGVDEKIDYVDTWRGFESVLDQGLARAIGVSNFNVQQLTRLVEGARVRPAVNQVELNLNLGQADLVSYCQGQGIVVVAYSPFGTMVPSRAYEGSPEPKLDNPTMVAIGKKYGKTVTQVALRYLFQRGIVSIPKTNTKSRVVENASIFDFELSPLDVAELAKFDNGFRTVRPVFWQNYENYPFEKIHLDPVPAIPESLKKWKNGINGDIE